MAEEKKKNVKSKGLFKSIVKRFHSFSGRPTASTAGSSSLRTCQSTGGLHPVYVGPSRRRYLIGPQLFQVLLRRSKGASVDVSKEGEEEEEEEEEEEAAAAFIGCEVVFFEHLLWMLENSDEKNESIDELVEFYT